MVFRPVPYPDEPPNIEKDTLYPYPSPLLERLQSPQDLVPAGDFLLPICTTKSRMLALLKVIRAGAASLDLQFIGDHSIDVLQALANLDNPTDTPCLSVDGDLCRLYKPSGSIFEWELWSPYSNDPFPTGYNRAPFVVYDPANMPAWVPGWVTDNLLGLQPGDVFTSIDAFAATGLQDFLNTLTNPIEELPYVVINATGGNTLRLKLFGIPQGGFVRIYTRNQLGSGIIVDLDSVSVLDSELSDLLNLVLDGELFPEHIVDYDVPGTGTQEVVIVFLPDYSGGLSIGFGGGIRSVEVCGDVLEVEPEFRINNCILEWRPDSASAWIPLGNVCGQDGAAAPTPIVIISEPTPGNHLVEFDMDANGVPENGVLISNGVNGQDGAAAPTPIVTISEPTPGNHLVEFDMDANGVPEDGVLIADGITPPIPIVTISEPTPGNHLVEFDMDANGISENAVNISDGINGMDGVTPQPIVSDLPEGVFIGWDLNDNGTSDTTQVKISGDCDCDGTTLPTGFTDDQKCNAAIYIASQIAQLAKDAAYESIVNGNSGGAWWSLFKNLFTFNPFYDPSLAMLDYIEQQISDYNAFAAEIDAAESRLTGLLYCDPSDLLRTSAITNWNVEPVSATVTADAKEVIYQAILATPLNEWTVYLQDGLLQTGGDCSALCIPTPTYIACEYVDFRVTPGHFEPVENNDYGQWEMGEGWVRNDTAGTMQLWIEGELATPQTISYIEGVYFSYGAQRWYAVLYDENHVQLECRHAVVVDTSPSDGDLCRYTWTTPEPNVKFVRIELRGDSGLPPPRLRDLNIVCQ